MTFIVVQKLLKTLMRTRRPRDEVLLRGYTRQVTGSDLAKYRQVSNPRREAAQEGGGRGEKNEVGGRKGEKKSGEEEGVIGRWRRV